MKRRRAIKVFGAAALCGLGSCRKPPETHRFRHIAFGTEVGFQIHGLDDLSYRKLAADCAIRLHEMESLFSLYHADSLLSKLNREGYVESPPAEFVELITTALTYGERTGGLFDITVQPLWNWRQAWKEADLERRLEMEGDPWQKALSLVDYRKVNANGNRVEFAKKGMAITLNGIVQGHATDRIASLIRKHGARHALVNMGEYYALGNAPDGKPWKVELAATGETIPLSAGRALAVSAGKGHTFDPEGRFHHIFRPSDGGNPRPDSSFVVTATDATMADALSTTFAGASSGERERILETFAEADCREIP